MKKYAAFFGYALTSCGLLFADPLRLVENEDDETISVFRDDSSDAILVQNARADHRPYLHPIVSPDGNGILTEYSPGHHVHQTGLYWGFTHLNGRDYFHNPSDGYWQLVESNILAATGEVVQWETVYHLLDEEGTALMEESQVWSMRDTGERYFLDLVWSGKAHTEVTISEYDYGGLFLRMPWSEEIDGKVVNSSRQVNSRANEQRATWVDVGMEIEGRDDWGHIAIFDHPENTTFPMPWRVDRKMGVGPARSQLGDWKIPAGSIETFKHQFVVYTGELNDVELNEKWLAYGEQRYNSAEWVAARNESRQAAFLTGEEAVEAMTVADGLEVNLYASEPAITQPMAFCWDDRGRLWVAENRDYETRRTGFSADGNSRILILEDVDGDGEMDTRKVFMDGIPFPSALAWGFDGLWLGAPPNLLFVPDRDGDDKADVDDIEIRLTGWGIRDRHEVLNSFIWGPDGWLYGCQGFATPSVVGKPIGEGRIYRHGEAFPENQEVEDPQYIDGGIFRYHPIKDRFEVVAHGFSNPWGMDFDDNGQIFISACVIPHLWHVVPGGIYHRQGGSHVNPYVYSDIQTITNHRHRSAHGGARIYLADALPERYHNRIFMANIHEHALLTDILEPKGSGFIGHHGDDAVLANDGQWIGFSIEIGPDGAVYILDWHDPDICGIDVFEKDTGRIYRVAPPGHSGKAGLNLAKLSDEELVDLQHHRNDWYVRRARVLLQQRAEEEILSSNVHAALWEQFQSGSDTGRRLRSLWALHVTGGASQGQLTNLLEHSDAHIRAWAIQLLCEDMDPGRKALSKFKEMAANDPSPVTRLYLASALQRIPETNVWQVAEGLVGHAGDADDHNLPNMIWFGVEPYVAGSTKVALNQALESEIPMISNHIARRAVAAEKLDALVAVISKTDSSTMRVTLLEGMRDGLAGQRYLQAPRGWSALEGRLLASGTDQERNLALNLGHLFGSAEAGKARLAQLQDPDTDLEQRKEILTSFGREIYGPAFPSIVGFLDDADLRESALRALGAYDRDSVPREILNRYSRFNAAEKSVAIQTLAARRETARILMDSLRAGDVPKNDISAVSARQMSRVIGPSFVDYWGGAIEANPLAKDKRIVMDRYQILLTDDYLSDADLMAGKALFEQSCASCHKLYGEGGEIGPDITGSNRADLDYILTNMLDPSSEIPEGYQLVTINTQDGRTFAGNVANEDDNQVTLRMIGQDVIVSKSDILSRETLPVSMMPEGLLAALDDGQVRDLIAYLRTDHPIE
ncbi:MAG: c-type cytochrome [Opitutales bacterium]|nr:c-type cytochrome [Opitutales bacterium]